MCLLLHKKAIGSQEEQAGAALELLAPNGQQVQPDMRSQSHKVSHAFGSAL